MTLQSLAGNPVVNLILEACLKHQVLPDEILYAGVRPEDAAAIVGEHLKQGRPVTRLLFDPAGTRKYFPAGVTPTHRKQLRLVLRNCGLIDPERIDDYLARDGYAALEKALGSLKPAQIIAELDLLRPIYEKTSAYGHFGRVHDLASFTWERTDKTKQLLAAVK